MYFFIQPQKSTPPTPQKNYTIFMQIHLPTMNETECR